ncbi:hypothetical protein GO497_00610 [Acidovorax citrulli]|nr:hypothetical protein [Paracidovorax citrulli]
MRVPKGAFLDALGMLCKNPLLCAAAAAAPAIAQWLSDGKIGVNPNGADYPNKPFLMQKEMEADGWDYRLSNSSSPWFPTKSKACQWWADQTNANPTNPRTTSSVAGNYCVNTTSYGSDYKMWERRLSSSTSIETMPASLDDIAPYMDLPETPTAGSNLARDLLDKGAEIQLPSAPTVTGPSQVQGPKEETVNPDGTKTVKQTTNNYQTDGNRITNTSTTTVTQRCVGDGTCSPVTTTTTTNPDEKPDDKDDGDDCKKNPDSLACADLDTPSGEIPKSTRNVTFNDENLFGGGACPADIYANVARQNMKIWDWQQSCGYITSYVRPVLLIICTYIAFMIVSGAARDGA